MDIYPFDVMVSIGESNKQLVKSLKRYEGSLMERDYELCKYTSAHAQGRACMFTNNASFLRIRKLPKTPKEFGSLAHEIFHVATFIMDRIGMKLEVMVSDEAYAYLISYLTERIYKRTNKYY